MRFFNVTAKLGNMRKEQEFTIYPIDRERPNIVTIQSDKRIALVNLEIREAMLSDGKGGHQGHWKTRADQGATRIGLTPEVVDAIKAELDEMLSVQNADGSVNLSSL